MAFLHGAEVYEFETGPAPIIPVNSSVVGLVGSAPLWALNGALQLWDFSWLVALGQEVIDGNGNVQTCTTAGTTSPTVAPTWESTLGATTVDGTATWTLTQLGPVANLQEPVLVTGNGATGGSGQASSFGPMVQGYSIPYALNAIFKQGAGLVVVVNVFDPTKHSTTITALAMTLPATGAQVLNLGHMGVSGFKLTNSGATLTYVEGTDFTLDHLNGVVTAKSAGALTASLAVKATFNYADPSKVTDATLVGAVTSGVYTGLQNFLLCYSQMGFFPNILIAPAFGASAGWQSAGSQDATTASALTTLAETIRAIALIDAPPLTPVATAESNRGVIGNPFNTASDRVALFYPWELFDDTGIVPTGVTLSPSAGAPVQTQSAAINDSPYSQWVAGAILASDAARGYWYSPSNYPVAGILGPDVPLGMSYLNPEADTNILNSDGIVTVFGSFATGLRVWGNRSSAYPSFTTLNNFISVRRVMDLLETSVELAMLQYLDQPISNGLISAILADINAFIRSLIQLGALVPGSAASYNPAENPASQLANGQLVFDLDVAPPPPAERLTFNVYVDSTLLGNITGSAQGQVG